MHYTLFELNNLVRQTIEQTLSEEYWVEAELSEARQVNGHCYMELVEKDDLHNTPVAKASAKCWRGTWSMFPAQVHDRDGSTAQGWHEGADEGVSAVS